MHWSLYHLQEQLLDVNVLKPPFCYPAATCALCSSVVLMRLLSWPGVQ
jgi:hypothetical protein